MVKKNKDYDKKIFRLIRILNLLDSGRQISSQALAKEFNVSVRSIQRDVMLLGMAGFPLINPERGKHAFVQGFSLKKMNLTGEEASLLTFFYDITKPMGSFFQDIFKSIMQKAIAGTMESPFYMKVSEGTKLREDYPFLQSLERAIDESRKISTLYKIEKTGVEGRHTVLPLKIIFFDGFWYLLSQSKDRKRLLKFRLENIKEVKVLDETFEPPENLIAILNESVNIWFDEKRDKKVTLKIDKEAARYFKKKAYFPLQKITKENADGSLAVECMANNYNEVIPTIFRWMPGIRVIGPKELKEEIKNIMAEYLKGSV